MKIPLISPGTKLTILREAGEMINSQRLSALARQSVLWVGTAWALTSAMACFLLVPTRLAPTQLRIPVPHLDEGHRNSPFMPASPVSKHMAVEHLEKARELAGRVGTWAGRVGRQGGHPSPGVT